MQMHDGESHTQRWPRLAFCLGALLLTAQLLACKDASVVSETNANKPVATPTPAASPVATATPSSSPGVTASPTATVEMTTARASVAAVNPAAGQNPQPTPALPPDSKLRQLGDFPIKVGPAKIPTPAPEPFKARPTPTIVLENGKIKQQWPAPTEAANQANPVKDRPDAVRLGRELYLQRCADCHGREGKGNGYLSAQLKRTGQPITPTNLTSRMVQANTDGELFWKITNGKSPMPANHQRFDDEQRWYIVAFLRTLK